MTSQEDTRRTASAYTRDAPPERVMHRAKRLGDAVGMASTQQDHVFGPDEQPVVPGSPYTPWHPWPRRVRYGAIAIGVGISGSFANALVTVNIASLAGGIGEYVVLASWLPAIFVAMNACANLMLIKSRWRFGIPLITRAVVVLYVCMALLQFALPGFATALAVRAASGIAAAALTTLGLYALLQALPKKVRPAAVAIAIVLPQFATPLARMVPVELLAQDAWRGLRLFELGTALAALAFTWSLSLPPSHRLKAFERLDFATIAILVPAFILLCGVLGLGRVVWWTDAPWLGVMLAVSVVLFAIAIGIERSRRIPLIHVTWLGTADLLRFTAVAVLVRLALAEQSYGAVGLLTSGGLNNDQLRTLFLWVLVAMVLGTLTAAVTLSLARLPYQVMAAAFIIAIGAWLDSDANNLTRPEQLYLSQALIGFGTTLFIGPALLYGLFRLRAATPQFLVSFVVLFGVTQNVGGLAGSALLGSYQQIAAREHAQVLSAQLAASDANVATRLQGGASTLAPSVVDPGLRSARSGALLAQALNREANVLAFNDVFRVVAILAAATGLYVAYLIAVAARKGDPSALDPNR